MREILAIVHLILLRHLRAAIHAHLRPPEQAGMAQGAQSRANGKEVSFTLAKAAGAILNKLVEAEGFDKFLHVKYNLHQALRPRRRRKPHPGMEQIIKRGGALGIQEIRPQACPAPGPGSSVLANVMEKPYRAVFTSFRAGRSNPEDVDGVGRREVHPLAPRRTARSTANQRAPVAHRPNPRISRR